MRLTKYEHACFTLEHEGKLLVVDPGGWTTNLPALENVVGIVVTHEHPDHFDVNALGAIIAHSPEAIVYAHESITRQFGDTIRNHSVSAGESIDCGPFHLEFFGGTHAVIHESFEPTANLGVLINETIYYPGDSFTEPARPIKVLALPVTAPWLRISDAMNYASKVKADLVFPTHDAVASDSGKQLPDKMIPAFVEAYGGTYRRLTGPIDIDG